MRILKNRKSVPKPYFTNKMLEQKSVQTRNPNPTKIKQKAIFCKRPFFKFRASPFFGFLREFVGRVARFVHESWKRLVNASPLATLMIGPSTWLLSRKQNNLIRMYCLFSWVFVQLLFLQNWAFWKRPFFPQK